VKTPEQETVANTRRQLLAFFAGALVALLGLFIWYELKVAVMSSWWGGISIFFMPTIIGLGVGITMRSLRSEGTFGLAGSAAFVTFIAGLLGMAVQHWINVDRQLHKLAKATYNETLDYAKSTIAILDEKKLREALANNETAVVARLVTKNFNGSSKEFWFRRNYVHFHWLAARQIIIAGQGGADRTIWEATKVIEDGPFLDDVIRTLAKKPVTDADLSIFKEMELPFLRKLADGEIQQPEFETPLVKTVTGQINATLLISRGFEPFTAGFVVVGCIVAFKLVREISETELI
jgi:hypothetical protein